MISTLNSIVLKILINQQIYRDSNSKQSTAVILQSTIFVVIGIIIINTSLHISHSISYLGIIYIHKSISKVQDKICIATDPSQFLRMLTASWWVRPSKLMLFTDRIWSPRLRPPCSIAAPWILNQCRSKPKLNRNVSTLQENLYASSNVPFQRQF